MKANVSELVEDLNEITKRHNVKRRELMNEHLKLVKSFDEIAVLLALKGAIDDPAATADKLLGIVTRARQEIADLCFAGIEQ